MAKLGREVITDPKCLRAVAGSLELMLTVASRLWYFGIQRESPTRRLMGWEWNAHAESAAIEESRLGRHHKNPEQFGGKA